MNNLNKLSPCKINFIDPSKIPVGAWYNIGSKCINISNNLTKIDKNIAIIHEIGHALCHEKNCICLQDYPKLAALAELHAILFEMNYWYKNKNKTMLCEVIRTLMYNAGRSVRTCHTIAIKQIIKYKLFTECVNYINKYEQLLLFN